MKSYSDIEQSKKLAEILPIESADMHWQYIEEDNGQLQWFCFPKDFSINQHNTVLAWSLAALLDVLPKDIIVHGTIYSINIYTKNKKWFIDYKCNNEEFIGSYSNIFIDACFKLIIKLHEQKLL